MAENKGNENADAGGIPDMFDMPPFFTIQPVAKTREVQFQMWTELITYWLASKKKTSISITKDINNFPFINKKINRKLKQKDLIKILDYMKNNDYGSWNDDEKTIFSCSWKKMNDWANLIYKYITDNAFIGKILTLYDLYASDDVSSEPFYNLDPNLILKILDILEEQGKAQVFTENGQNIDEYGVKFYEV